MILSAQEHRQNLDGPALFFDVEPVDRPIERQMPRTRQDVVVAFAATGGDGNALRGRRDVTRDERSDEGDRAARG